MTRTLVLIRHGKSDWSRPVLDWERPLARRGRIQARPIGRWLARHDIVPDLVLLSPTVRARQTWDLVEAGLTDPLVEDPTDNDAAILDELAELADVADVADVPQTGGSGADRFGGVPRTSGRSGGGRSGSGKSSAKPGGKSGGKGGKSSGKGGSSATGRALWTGRVHVVDAIYTGAIDLYDVVCGLESGIECAALIGHQPLLSDLAESLTGRFVPLKTSTLAVIDLPDWAAERGAGRLRALGRPADGDVAWMRRW